jgi:hypothetical protein
MTGNHDWCNGGCEGCPEDPKALTGAPIGMYHCPYCSMMLMAGQDKHMTCQEMDNELARIPDNEEDY